MAEQYALRDFLEHNRGFAFHLPEFVESTRFIAEVNERFAAFCRGFTPGAPLAGGWAERREEIRHGVREVPAYRCIDWSRPDYWETIPFIDKDDLRSRPDDFISPRYDRAKLWLRETSGTTGPPVSIWYAPEFFFGFHLLSAARAAWVAGRLTEEVRRRTVFCLALVDNKYLAERVWTSPAPFPGLTLRAVFDERRASSARRVAALVARHRPALLTLKPNVLGSLVGRLRAPCDAAARGLRLVVASGADLDPALRRTAERLLGVPVTDVYGLSEVGVVASECAHRDGLHVYEGQVIAEVLHEDGVARPAGAGELVLSSVANGAMPMLRYRTGDLVDLVTDPCPCGMAGARIRGISGRIIRNFPLPDGSEYAPTNLHSLFKSFPIREFRLTQTAVDRLRAEVELLPACAAPAQTLAAIRGHIEGEMRGLVRVEVSEAAFGTDGKFQRFRTLVPAARR